MDKSQRFRILLITGDSADADTIAAALSGPKEPAFSVEWVAELSAAFLRLSTEEQIDAVVLDLFLPDCAGLGTFQRLRRAMPDMPLNAVAERMTGWTPQDAAGRLLAEVFHIIDATTRQPTPHGMPKAVQENDTVGLTQHSILVRRDGWETFIENSPAPVHDRQGRLTGAVIVFHEVSAAGIAVQITHSAYHRRVDRPAEPSTDERSSGPGD
jgi:PAS domain S-box-containing protein